MTLTEPHSATPPPTTRQIRRRGGWFGALMLRLHFYAGILIGPFILVAALSGALYALTPQLEHAVYSQELHAPHSETTLSLATQIETANEYIGDDAVLFAVRPAPENDDTTRIMYSEDGLGSSESRAVFVDPGTGEIRGDLVVYGTSGSTPLRTWISNLHRNLNLGDTGRLYSELAASWLGIVAVAGLALWVMRIRTARGKRDLLRPNLRHRGYHGLLGWHASVGVWVLLGAIFLSATGITWSQYAGANIADLRASFDGGTPTVNTSLDGAEPAADEHAHHRGAPIASTGAANPETFDAVLAIAQRENVNTGEVEIKPPAESGTAWTVREIKTGFPTEADSLAIDGTTMQVVDRVDFADFPLTAKLASWGVNLHMGVMFGLANQIILFVIASALVSMTVLGYLMWWRRRPMRDSGRLLGAPPPPALRAAPWWGIGVVATASVLIGLWLPLVGWTLLVFVAIDTMLGKVRQQRRRAQP
ncbi:PepSY-associated TM helix domain-containing protein [Microbacterium sp. Leaf159]|uniref:PepSY-associated TM helix domain-containing protein n=1 Tax=Microbacterium sp. Leaf159 TaxID=1736279 RepID=UPI0006F9B277|nr:PepSY-associated TM helix domain-containing protein [Microbacterium sp. Leaf159]KQR38146.1 peptidase [Microbacterium sp. Leaf159]